MTVKNGENYISECIESVLNQTFSDFEFLIFDDQSADRTVDIIKKYKDNRIQVFTDTRGYIGNLNRGIEISRGQYIAKMDHDDIMKPEKLKIQVEVMDNTMADVCFTWIYHFGESVPKPYIQGSVRGFIENPLKFLSSGNEISHPTVVMRKEFLKKHHIQYEEYFPADDYKLWFEMAKNKGKFYMVPKPLLSYRLSLSQSGTIFVKEQRKLGALVQQEIRDYIKKTQLYNVPLCIFRLKQKTPG